MLITLRNVEFYLVSGLLDQLQILWQFYLIELLGILMG